MVLRVGYAVLVGVKDTRARHLLRSMNGHGSDSARRRRRRCRRRRGSLIIQGGGSVVFGKKMRGDFTGDLWSYIFQNFFLLHTYRNECFVNTESWKYYGNTKGQRQLNAKEVTEQSCLFTLAFERTLFLQGYILKNDICF